MRPMYLRLSITDRCNFRCGYCRPGPGAAGADGPAAGPRLPDAALLDLVQRLHRVRPLYKVRLTGGEPLLRPGVVELVARLRAALPEVELCLTTNGAHLAPLARPLRRAGLDRVNVSMDTADPARFAQLTGGDLAPVLAGIAAARAAGFTRLKLNAVLQRSCGSADQLCALLDTARRHGAQIRFIELMPIGQAMHLYPQEHLPAGEALRRLSARFKHVRALARRGTAQEHLLRDAEGLFTVGFISPISAPFCAGCERLRLDCRGRLFACLRDWEGVALGPLLGAGQEAALLGALQGLLLRKAPAGASWPPRPMVSIGG